MKRERNEFIEIDGMFWESDTHEWFRDKSSTHYAQKKDVNGISLPNIVAVVIRNKKTGDYDRALMDIKTNDIIYESKQLEEIGVHIDILKVLKQTEK